MRNKLSKSILSTKEESDARVEDILGLVWKNINNVLDCTICAGPFCIEANLKTKDLSLKDIIKLLV